MPTQLEKQQQGEEEEEEEGAEGAEGAEEEEASTFYFCDQPHADYAHVIFASTTDDSLWSLEAIQSVCRFDQVTISSFSVLLPALGYYFEMMADGIHNCVPTGVAIEPRFPLAVPNGPVFDECFDVFGQQPMLLFMVDRALHFTADQPDILLRSDRIGRF